MIRSLGERCSSVKGFFIRAGIFVISTLLILLGAGFILSKSIPTYPFALAEDNSVAKQKGEYLISHMPSDNVLILGSSELTMKMIPSLPSNLLANGRAGFVPNPVGKGSTQALIHASLLAAAKNVSDKKVVILVFPQSFVKQGIAPDAYLSNFSEQQFCTILLDSTLQEDIRSRIKERFVQLFEKYTKGDADLKQYEWFAKSEVAKTLSLPYLYAKSKMLDIKDKYLSYVEYKKAPQTEKDTTPIDWQRLETEMLEVAKSESDNNDFGFLNDYYSVNVGERLPRFSDRDVKLSYADSVEYRDLTLLLDVCKDKGIKPLVIAAPFHGLWSDYTGLPVTERNRYYANIKEIVSHYNVTFLRSVRKRI